MRTSVIGGGDRTPEGMKAGAAHFSPHFISGWFRGESGGFRFGDLAGGGCVGGAVFFLFLNRFLLASRSCCMQASRVGRVSGGEHGCGRGG